MRRIALAATLLFAAAAVAGFARPEGARAVDPAPAPTDTVTVTGAGSVRAVPGRAQLSLGVESRAATAREALTANAREMRQVIVAIRAAGGKDIQTQSVSLSPQVGEDGAVTGFVASNTVTTTVDVARSGTVIDAAVAAGANQVWGPSLSVGDADGLYRQALEAAVADARDKAEALAGAAGRTLGPVTTIVEGGGSTPVPMLAKADAATPIEAGSQEIAASVTVTFAMR